MNQEGIAFILSAPSGTGKSTVCKILREKIKSLQFSVSHTTRPPRPNEKNGQDYHFISGEEFKQRVDQKNFLEWAQVHNNYYGTSIDTVEQCKKDGKDILLELDVQGVQTLRKMNFPGVFIFLLPPSLEELRNRLNGRGTESQIKINERIETGKNEILLYRIYDYVVTNRDVAKTVDILSAIITAEKSRSERYWPTAADLQALIPNQDRP
jgi:guanylate kinase